MLFTLIFSKLSNAEHKVFISHDLNWYVNFEVYEKLNNRFLRVKA